VHGHRRGDGLALHADSHGEFYDVVVSVGALLDADVTHASAPRKGLNYSCRCKM